MADLVFPGSTGTTLNATALPANNDLIIYKGDYVELFVTIKDNLGVAISLSGATPKAQLKADYSDRNPKAFTCTLPGPTGQVRIYLPSTITSTLIPGSYIWDFQVTFANGDTRTYLAGDVTVYNEVTT
jgi:hypothetical protein